MEWKAEYVCIGLIWESIGSEETAIIYDHSEMIINCLKFYIFCEQNLSVTADF